MNSASLTKKPSTRGKQWRMFAAFAIAVVTFWCVALGLVAAPATASADDGQAVKTAPPANSWRYVDGVPRASANTDGPEVPELSLAADAYVRFTLSGSTWQGELDGEPISVSNALGFGVDVSQWQGAIDWARAKRAGVDFAIIRCGYGGNVSYQDDSQFLANVRGCLENDIPFGLYLYSYAVDTADAQSEADHVLRLLNDAGLSPSDLAYPIYIDLEDQTIENCGKLPEISQTFCGRMEAAGYWAGVYSNLYWWTTKLTDPVFDRWERWVAQWRVSGGENVGTSYTGSYGVWQCLGGLAWVDGIGAVDANFDYRIRNYVPRPDQRTGAVYRLYHRVSGEHLFTADLNEAQVLMRGEWTYERRAWTAPTTGKSVYRLFNTITGDHLFTSDLNEYNVLGAQEWNQEGAKFCTTDDGPVPIYRLFNPGRLVGTHLLTTDYNEYQTLPNYGWIQEGVACRAIDW